MFMWSLGPLSSRPANAFAKVQHTCFSPLPPTKEYPTQDPKSKIPRPPNKQKPETRGPGTRLATVPSDLCFYSTCIKAAVLSGKAACGCKPPVPLTASGPTDSKYRLQATPSLPVCAALSLEFCPAVGVFCQGWHVEEPLLQPSPQTRVLRACSGAQNLPLQARPTIAQPSAAPGFASVGG